MACWATLRFEPSAAGKEHSCDPGEQKITQNRASFRFEPAQGTSQGRTLRPPELGHLQRAGKLERRRAKPDVQMYKSDSGHRIAGCHCARDTCALTPKHRIHKYTFYKPFILWMPLIIETRVSMAGVSTSSKLLALSSGLVKRYSTSMGLFSTRSHMVEGL